MKTLTELVIRLKEISVQLQREERRTLNEHERQDLVAESIAINAELLSRIAK